jgi:hypothetical protein
MEKKNSYPADQRKTIEDKKQITFYYCASMLSLCTFFRNDMYDTILKGKHCKKSCHSKDISHPRASAPIAITNVEQSVMPGDSMIQLLSNSMFMQRNKVGLKLIMIDKRHLSCKKSTEEDYDTIWVHSFKFSDYEYKEGHDYSMSVSKSMRLTQNGYSSNAHQKESANHEIN